MSLSTALSMLDRKAKIASSIHGRKSAAFAIRVYSGMLKVQEVQTSNHQGYILLSFPYYLLDRMKDLVEEMIWNYLAFSR